MTKRYFLLTCFLVLALVVAPSSGAQEQIAPPITPTVNQDGDLMRVIVTLHPAGLLLQPLDSAPTWARRQAISRGQDAILARLGGEKTRAVRRFTNLPMLALEVTAPELQVLARAPEVLQVQEDRLARPLLDISVPLIGAPSAWESAYTGAGQTVVILDTGVDSSHPFLQGKVIEEACFSTTDQTNGCTSLCPGGAAFSSAVGSGQNCQGIQDCEHGTHVAGIIAGSNEEFSGVAPGANIISIQVFSRFDNYTLCGGESPCIMSYASDQIAALDYVYDELHRRYDIAAVNMSLGGSVYTAPCDDSPLASPIEALRDVGITTVVAAGNYSLSGLCEPACVSSALSVGSTIYPPITYKETVSTFSNSATFLDLLAPGEYIRSSVPGSKYEDRSGTSMAAPHVAGALALLRSADPEASPDEMQEALTSSGLPILDGRNGLVKPRIQVDGALSALSEAENTEPAASPTQTPVADVPIGTPEPATQIKVYFPLMAK